MNKFFLMLLGILLASLGLTFIILYLNLLTIGYNLIDYLRFIILNIYCLLFPIGMALIYFSTKNN
jgi:hypothetical protein